MNYTDIKVIHETNHYIVVIKPVGILSQGDCTGDLDMLTLVKQYLKNKYNKPGDAFVGLVHRLDRMTSGLMVFAKTSKGASRLSEQIKNHQMGKSYMALIEGHMVEKEGSFIDSLSFDKNKRFAYVDSFGKIAELKYKVIEEYDDSTLVHVDLITGRHHQIRVQFGLRHHPLVGDTLYGSKVKKPIKLHAFKLSFLDPVSKEDVLFINTPEWFERK